MHVAPSSPRHVADAALEILNEAANYRTITGLPSIDWSFSFNLELFSSYTA